MDDRWRSLAAAIYEEHWDTLRGNTTIEALAAALRAAHLDGWREGREAAAAALEIEANAHTRNGGAALRYLAKELRNAPEPIDRDGGSND